MGETLLTSNTPITVGLVIVIIGFVFWLSKLYAQGRQNEKDLAEHKQKTDEEINLLKKEVKELRDKQDLRSDKMQESISSMLVTMGRIDVNVNNLLKKNG